MGSCISVDSVRQILHYNPMTGVFRWRRPPNSRIRAWAVAGCLKPPGYWHIRIEGKNYTAHRLAWFYMTGVWPNSLIDHRDGNRSDNRWANLREATKSQNMANSRTPKNNTTGFKGVRRHGHKFRAAIISNGKQRHLGTFSTLEDARTAYATAARNIFGEYARIA